MKTRHAAKYVVLGALMANSMHGYEIRNLPSAHLGWVWHVGTSQFYVLLKKLEEWEWVSCRVESEGNRPLRKTYTVTPGGETRFRSCMQRSTAHMRDLRGDFLSKLFFYRYLGMEGGFALIESQIRFLEDLREKIKGR